jgi:hypothetical protein
MDREEFCMSNRWLCIGFAAICAACGSSRDSNKMDAVSERAGSAGAGGSAGSTALGPLTPVIPNLMCDTSVVSEKTCGSQTCPDVPSYLAAACTVNCCTAAAKCGTRNTLVNLSGGQCMETGMEDSRCPSATVAGFTSPGCCDPQNQCGQLIAGSCVVIPTGVQTQAARKCDAAPDEDAGS